MENIMLGIFKSTKKKYRVNFSNGKTVIVKSKLYTDVLNKYHSIPIVTIWYLPSIGGSVCMCYRPNN